MKRAFCITAFMLPLLVASTSFAPEAHPWAPFSANESAMREPTALISSSGHADEEEPSIFPDGFPSVFPVPNTTATLSPSELSSQSGDDVVYRRGPTVVESTLPPSPGPASAVKYADVPFTHSSGLSVTYNAFDLPERISQGTALKAKYTYTADGTKVSALDASGAGLVYRGPFTYRRTSGGSLSFESATFDRGRLTEAGVRYHVTDHLGSVRAVIDGSASTAAYPLAGFYSTDDYAPYGTKSASSASSYLSLASTGTTVSLRDGFTGKENQGPDFSVGYIDFGARQYSPSISRWLVPDPMGEKYYDVSPYAYCAGNPINLVDYNGEALHVLAGAVIGGIVNGGIALYQGKTGRELVGAVAGGVVFGTITAATGGANLLTSAGYGLAGGIAGSLTEQVIGNGSVDIGQVVVEGISSAASGATSSAVGSYIEKTSAKAIQAIDRKYTSQSVQKEIRKEVKKEFRNVGRSSGKSTNRELNSTVAERAETLSGADKTLVKALSSATDKVQEEIISWGMDESTQWAYEKYKDK